MRAGAGGQRGLLDLRVRGLSGHYDEGLLLGNDLDHRGQVDLEDPAQYSQAFAEQLVDVLTAERALSKARDLLLLARLQTADLFAGP